MVSFERQGLQWLVEQEGNLRHQCDSRRYADATETRLSQAPSVIHSLHAPLQRLATSLMMAY